MKAMNDELLIKYLLKETEPEEDRLVISWIQENPENRKHFSRLETIWKASKNLASASSVDEDQAWERFKSKRDAQTEAFVRPLFRLGWIRYAAVLLLAAAGIWSVYSYLNPSSKSLVASLEVTKSTLPDGSTVTLNRNSSLSYSKAFDDVDRKVTLDSGEAFFNVTPNKAKPFVVDAHHVTVSVVGTSFNVRQTKAETEVIVETGVVEVRVKDQRVMLRPGEKIKIITGKERLIKEVSNDKLYNYYRSKEFVAENTPLWRVVEVLNEAYGAHIEIQDPRVRQLKLTTTFREESLDTILRVIGETFDLQIEKQNDKIVLKE